MPKMRAIKKVSYEIDKDKGAIEQLFEDAQQDGEYELVEQDMIAKDDDIGEFVDRMSLRWGEEES